MVAPSHLLSYAARHILGLLELLHENKNKSCCMKK
jgi:hypothetical protein